MVVKKDALPPKIKNLLGDYISSGSYGSVYNHKSEKDKVVKISNIDFDTINLSEASSTASFRGVTKIFDVLYSESLVISIREKINPNISFSKQEKDDIIKIIDNYNNIIYSKDHETESIQNITAEINKLKKKNNWRKVDKTSKLYHIYKLLYINFPFNDIGYNEESFDVDDPIFGTHNIGLHENGYYVVHDC